MLNSLINKYGKTAAKKPVQLYETWARMVARGIQFIFAIVVIGIYGNRVDNDRKAGNAQDPAWIYALAVAGLSCITCLVFIIPQPFFKSARLFAWDAVLFILWIALFGTFAGKFLKVTEDKVNGISVTMMKTGVWIDLVNAILWLCTGVYGVVRVFVGKKANQGINKIETKATQKFNEKVGAKVNERFPGAADAYGYGYPQYAGHNAV